MDANEFMRKKIQSVLNLYKEMAIFEGYEVTGPESPGMDGDTPLHITAMDGRLDLLAAMLPFVQNIDAPGDLGNTPLHYVVLKGHIEIANFLLDNGVNIDRENDYSETPFGLMLDRPRFEMIIQKYKVGHLNTGTQ